MQAIIVKYRGPTNHNDARWIVSCAAKRMTVPYNYIFNLETNAAIAAQKLAEKLQWKADWRGGQLPNGDWVYVQYKRNSDHDFTSNHEVK